MEDPTVGDPRKTVPCFPTEVELSEGMREVEALTTSTYPDEERRDLRARKIQSHVWAHLPRPDLGEEELTMRRELDRLLLDSAPEEDQSTEHSE